MRITINADQQKLDCLRAAINAVGLAKRYQTLLAVQQGRPAPTTLVIDNKIIEIPKIQANLRALEHSIAYELSQEGNLDD